MLQLIGGIDFTNRVLNAINLLVYSKQVSDISISICKMSII